MPSSGDKTSTREKKSSGSSSSKKSKKDKDPSSTEQRKKEKKKSKQRSKSPKTTKERGKSSSSTPSGKESPPLLESQAAPYAQQSSPHAQQSPPLPSEQDPKASQDFQAGQLFQKFARNGGVDARDFQRLWRQRGTSISPATPKDCNNGVGQSEETTLDKELRKTMSGGDARDLRPEKTFEMGQLFQKFDTDGDGRLRRADLERMMSGILSLSLGESSGDERAVGDGRDREGGAPDNSGPSAMKTEVKKGQNAIVRLVGAPVPPGPTVTHYDETTGVPLAREAVASQLSLGHTVVSLREAYEKRLSRIQTLASSRLMPAREQLLKLRRRLHIRAEEVKAAKAAAERETLADAAAIVERLRSVEALKQASLTQTENDVVAELESVEKLADQIKGVTSNFAEGLASVPPGEEANHDFGSTNKMVELIQSYPELCASIDRVANKPIDQDVSVLADDLPHETAERLDVLRRADQYEKALGVKDHMVWKALQESEALAQQCEQEHALGQEFAREAQEWVALSTRLADDLRALKEERATLTEANKILRRENQDVLRRLRLLEGARN